MNIEAMCKNCNDFLKDFNEVFILDSFWWEHYKTRHCLENSIGIDGNKINCLTIYGERVKYYSLPATIPNQPERLSEKTSKDDAIV